MKILLIWVVCLTSFGQSAASDQPDSQPSALNTDVLDNKRLFFNQRQRQGNVNKTPGTEAAKKRMAGQPLTVATSANTVLARPSVLVRYDGVIRSDRGILLMINGVVWRPGLSSVARARIQQDTNTVEIETDVGKRYRLQPGQSIELLP